MASTPVLFVENDPNDAILIQRALRKLVPSIQISIVPSGREAIDYLAGRGDFTDRTEHPAPSLLVLDLKMPRLSGLDVIEWVRAQADWSWLPCVVLTNSADEEDVQRAYKVGASSYLVKPANFEALQEMLACMSRYWVGFNHTPVQAAAHRSSRWST